MHSKRLSRAMTGGLLALLCTLPAAAANLAGSTVFVSGKVTATDPAGGVRELKASDEVYSGDLLETRKGRVQIKFIDGAFMSIQPNSRFQIEDYNYANKSDGSEKAIYNLLKGGMRAFTGAIGKKHPDAYKVKTPVATIGVRGTGHNTRICQGDCYAPDGTLLPDGLRHSTWEGLTTVTNNTGITEVPLGKSVYVKSMDSPAQETGEASQVTAVQPSLDTVQELVEDNQEQVTLEAGDQVNSRGFPDDLQPPLPTGLTRVANQTLLGIEPDLSTDITEPDNAGGGLVSDTTVLVGRDSTGTFGIAGAIGTDMDENDMGNDEMREVLLTIDPTGILDISAPDSAVSLAQGFITDALGTDPALVNSVIADPATVAEYTEGTWHGSSYAYGRWSDGNILFIDEVTEPGSPDFGHRTVEVDTLAADQSLHLLFGDTADTRFGAGATGTYDFLGGTASTGTNGGLIGSGVVAGSLAFDFTSLEGTVDMEVLHGTTYMVNGGLKINSATPVDFDNTFNSVTAVTTGGGACDKGCDTLIDGSFFGSPEGGAPVLAGLDYEIITLPFDGKSGESIIGNAMFGRTGTATPIPDTFTVLDTQGLVAVLPNPTQPPPFPDEFANVGALGPATNIVGDDSLNNNGLLLTAGRELDDTGDGLEEFFVAVTIDPDGMLGVTDTDPNVVAAQVLINAALVTDNALVQSVNNEPAKVVEFFQGSGFAYGRWADGKVLLLDENIGGITAPTGTRTVEADTLTGSQSLHFLYGDAPTVVLSQGATGTYDFEGGTHSTTVSGAGIGQGITSGQLSFDFANPFTPTINMNVNHDLIDYTVAGVLELDTANPGRFFDPYNGAVTATTAGRGSECFSGCDTLIDGGFAGALSAVGGGIASPEYAGLEYAIDATDGIMGVGLFRRTGPAVPAIP